MIKFFVYYHLFYLTEKAAREYFFARDKSFISKYDFDKLFKINGLLGYNFKALK